MYGWHASQNAGRTSEHSKPQAFGGENRPALPRLVPALLSSMQLVVRHAVAEEVNNQDPSSDEDDTACEVQLHALLSGALIIQHCGRPGGRRRRGQTVQQLPLFILCCVEQEDKPFWLVVLEAESLKDAVQAESARDDKQRCVLGGELG